jgi:DNA-binding transcriptional ArsR family regulator
MLKIEEDEVTRHARIFKAFSSVTRLHIIELLLGQEQATWTELHDGQRSDMAPHIHVLEETGIIVVVPDPDRRHPNYRLADRAMCAVLLDEVAEFARKQQRLKKEST